MIWIIASIPFWTVAALFFVAAVIGSMAWVAGFAKDENDDKLVKAGIGIFALFLISGILTVIAANLCS